MLFRTMEDISDGVFRVLFSVIFVTAGAAHLVRPSVFVERLVAAPLGYLASSLGSPTLLVVLSGIALLIGGLGLVLGYFTRAASLLLIAVLIPITVTVDLGHTNALGPLFKNVALLGGLVHFAVHGPGAYSVDSAVERLRW
ncbi:MAG TPA: DoxX family protein [Candidatus Limnocylindria bacterium]|nr:DoxX family protein [Candidatus Limnocylindria bacterium]